LVDNLSFPDGSVRQVPLAFPGATERAPAPYNADDVARRAVEPP